MSQADPWDDTIPRELKGIGGWLWLVLLHLIATPIFVAMTAMARLKPLFQPATLHELTGYPVFLALTGVFVILLIARLLFGLFCLVQLLRRKAQLPRLMTIFYGLGIAISVSAVIPFSIDPDLYATLAGTAVSSGWIGFQTTLVIAVSGLFIVYFDISKRVKNTFVR
ncbi:MAG: DUF2569 domain-containing protein [Alphaproteobacteria bacterium]|nr:DUF2569 domain-containing protein [Alphaproteobacteria bacterium]MDE2630948.1 DUF2569 domain-containing protein [Alphaproteobacteria bacterium]